MKKTMKKTLALILSLIMVFSCFTGIITIVQAEGNSPKAGDINGDGNVNSKDLTRLMKHISGEEVEVVTVAIDPNGDGSVNNKDLTRLMRYIAGDDVEIFLSGCTHEKEEIVAVEATCTKEGNIAYWYCADCNKYFSDAEGVEEITLEETIVEKLPHTEEVIPGYPATTTETGLSDGKKCTECGYVIEPQKVIPISEYIIEYHIDDNDTYIKNLYLNGALNNPNPVSYSTETGAIIEDLIVPGYTFQGWYDAAGTSGNRVTRIEKGETGKVTLYARWSAVNYTITFNSKHISVSAIENYQVNKDSSLPASDVMNLPGYRWLGWSDENGNLYNGVYPAGKVGNITLYANWQSHRNQAVPVDKLADPKAFIDEDSGKYIFTFDLGVIKNVPILEVANYGKLIPGQPSKEVTTKETTSLTDKTASEFAKTIAKSTTKTATWSLSNEWNKISSVSESHCAEMGIDISTIEYDFDSETSGLALTSDAGASTNETVNWGVNAKIYGKNTAEVSAEAKFPVKCVDVGVGIKNTTEIGGELNGYYDNTTVKNAYWNTASAYNESHNTINSTTTTENLSKHVSDAYNYSTTTSTGGSQTESEAYSVNDAESEEYSTIIAYTTETITATEVKTTYTAAHEGWWRQVVAGTIHVIGVVSYDMRTGTYTVYTYNVLDEKTEMFMDFSMDSGDYDDYENGVIPFEVPYSVNEFISTSLGYSNGLEIDSSTGIITGYDKATHIHIPDYMMVNNGDGTLTPIKVTGIADGLFANDTELTSVRLGRYITEIPDNAFNGCTSLKTIEYDEISTIGANAFANCTSLKKFIIDTSITEIGENAFTNVPVIEVYAKNAGIVKSTATSGAKAIDIYLRYLTEELKDIVLAVPSSTDVFALYGRDDKQNAVSYSNLVIESNAKTTILNGMTFVNNKNTPLKLNSEKVTLAGVTVNETPGFGLILTADETSLYLNGKSVISTTGANPILCKSLIIAKVPDTNVTTSITAVGGAMLYCGTVTDSKNLYVGEKEEISLDSYDQLLNGSLAWVLASEMPEGAKVVNEKWSYDLTSKTSSASSTMDGWTLYDTQRTSWGSTVGPVYSDPSNGSRNVWSEQYVSGYNQKTVYVFYKYGNSPLDYSYPSYGSSHPNYYEVTMDYMPTSESNRPVGKSGSQYQWHANGDANWAAVYYSGTRTENNYSSPIYSTRWYYQEPVYTYYFTKTESLESTSEVIESESISNVQKWVQYVTK